MRKSKAIGLAGLAAAALVSSAALAHHGTSGSYDESKIVTVEGKVKEFRWRNPHSALFVVGKDATGKQVVYAIEMSSPNSAAKRGFTRTTMKPGDAVSVQIHPSFSNPTNGLLDLGGKILVNGQEVKLIQPHDGDKT